jgi:hypothetical protein
MTSTARGHPETQSDRCLEAEVPTTADADANGPIKSSST